MSRADLPIWRRILAPAAALLTPAVTLLSVPVAALAAPTSVQVEGVIQSAGGGPASDGTYPLTVGFYATKAGGQALWVEQGLSTDVKGGVFSVGIGTKTPLDGKGLAAAPELWLGVQVGSEPELPRVPVRSGLFALHATSADGLTCSGCVTAANLHAEALAPYAKTATLAKVATTGSYADLSAAPALHKVATTGNYADLQGIPDLSKLVLAASLHKVAQSGQYGDLLGKPTLADVASTGDYNDLQNLPVLAQVGKSCGTGLVVKGLKGDGSLECVAAMDPAALPADGLDEISNGLLSNQFIDVQAGKENVPIPDNSPLGVSDTLDFPDVGVAQKLTVTVDLANSDVAAVTVQLKDPAGTAYVLYDKGSKGGTLATTWPDPTPTVKGDLSAWIGKNPKGKWTLTVVDAAFKNNTTDGQINKWMVSIQTLSSKKVAVKGDLLVAGGVTIGKDDGACTAAKAGTVRWNGQFLQLCNGQAWTGLLGADGSSQAGAAKDCKTIKASNPQALNGLYWVDPNGGSPNDAFQAYCDMSVKGGGWIKVSEFAETFYDNLKQRNDIPYTEALLLEYDHGSSPAQYSNFVHQFTCYNSAKTGFQTPALNAGHCDNGWQIRIGGTGGSCGDGEEGCFGFYSGNLYKSWGCNWDCGSGAVTVYGKGYNCNGCRCRNAPYTTTAGCGNAGSWGNKRFWLFVR